MGKVRLEDLDEFARAGEQKFRRKDKTDDEYMYGSDRKPKQRKAKPKRG